VTALVLADLLLTALMLVLLCGVLASALIDWWRTRGP